MELADRDWDELVGRGLVRLERLVPASRIRAAKQAIDAELTRLGVLAQGKWHMARMPRALRHLPPLDEVIPGELVPCLAAFAGRTLRAAQPHPQLLLTPPGTVARGAVWAVPHLGWHLDVQSPSRDEIPGMQVFVLVDDVLPHGGGTVAITGSHELHGARGGVAVSAHQVLRDDPVYGRLFSPGDDRQIFLEPHVVRGVTVQVAEMCGRAGDVYVMDMRVVHAAAPNGTRRARMMLTSRYLPASDRP